MVSSSAPRVNLLSIPAKSAAALAARKAAICEPFMGDVGRSPLELPTPIVVLDLPVVRRNIARMAGFLADGPVGLRPHVKVHKSPDAALLQISEGGAHGVATATVWEAAVMLRSGIADVLIANQVVGAEKIAAAAALAGEGTLTVAVDDQGNAQALSTAAGSAGTEIGVLIEYDVGMGRGGVRNIAELRVLSECVAAAPGLALRGVMGYEGHCTSIPDRDIRAQETLAAMDRLAVAIDCMTAEGYSCDIVSGGGTGTYFVSGAAPPLTETQAGSYVVMDGFHASLVPEFELAMTVIGTVVSRHGSLVVLDTGRKAVSVDLEPPKPLCDRAAIEFVHEEHMGLTLSSQGDQVDVGDRVVLRPGYGPMTANLYDVFHVVEDGAVTQIWPILARHPGMSWL